MSPVRAPPLRSSHRATRLNFCILTAAAMSFAESGGCFKEVRDGVEVRRFTRVSHLVSHVEKSTNREKQAMREHPFVGNIAPYPLQ